MTVKIQQKWGVFRALCCFISYKTDRKVTKRILWKQCFIGIQVENEINKPCVEMMRRRHITISLYSIIMNTLTIVNALSLYFFKMLSSVVSGEIRISHYSLHTVDNIFLISVSTQYILMTPVYCSPI